MKEQGYKTSVLLHWNAEKKREEIWLFIQLSSSIRVEQVSDVTRIATRIISRRPLATMPAESYLHGKTVKRVNGWLAGPITEEEAATL
jgi:hypothetical protein